MRPATRPLEATILFCLAFVAALVAWATGGWVGWVFYVVGAVVLGLVLLRLWGLLEWRRTKRHLEAAKWTGPFQ